MINLLINKLQLTNINVHKNNTYIFTNLFLHDIINILGVEVEDIDIVK